MIKLAFIKDSSNTIIKIVTPVDKINSAFAKMPYFCHPDVLVTQQQFPPKSKKSRWVNNGCKLKEQLVVWETQNNCLVFPHSLTNLYFVFRFPLPTIVHLGWLVMSKTLVGETSVKLQKESVNAWSARSIILEKLFLSPEVSDPLPLGPLNTCN